MAVLIAHPGGLECVSRGPSPVSRLSFGITNRNHPNVAQENMCSLQPSCASQTLEVPKQGAPTSNPTASSDIEAQNPDIHICATPPMRLHFPIFTGRYLQETDFFQFSNFSGPHFPFFKFSDFSGPNFPFFQFSNFSGPNFQFSNFPIFLGLTLECWKVGKLGPEKLENWKIGKLENWKNGKLGPEKLEKWKVRP